MNTLTIISIIAVSFIATVIIYSLLANEATLIKKADKNFLYHIFAKIGAPSYTGYIMRDDEKKALKESQTKPTEYDKHPIGSYFSLCNSLKSTLVTCANFHNYKLNFNMSEVGVGVCVMLVFVGVVALGCIYG